MKNWFKFPFSFAALLCFSLFITQSTAAEPTTTYIINGITDCYANFGPADDVKSIELLNGQLSRYTDYPNGYSIEYPQQMKVDSSVSKTSTLIYDEKTHIEIFYDDLHNTVSTAWEYIEYGNRFTENTRDHTVEFDKMVMVGETQVHLLKWTRRKLSRVPNDKHYYISAEFIKNDLEVYTVFVKSSEPLADEMSIINSLRFISKQGVAGNFKSFHPSRTPQNAETKAFYHTFFSTTAPQRFGIFEPSAPESFHYLNPLEEKLEYSFPFLLRYQSLEEPFPHRGLQKAFEHNKLVELTLQTINSVQVSSVSNSPFMHDNASIIYDILDGHYDEYLNNYAQAVKAFGHPLLFRLNNEMNGDWCWYSAYYTSKDAEIYKALWRYIFETFEHNGVNNVVWIWNPHDVSRPDFKWNHHLMYYPGDEYVDVIGLTGYNTGTYFPGESWREFLDIYQPLYNEYMELFHKPFFISEFGSNSVGGDKVTWIKRMFKEIKQLSNIKVALWWSGIDYDKQGRPGRIYLIDEDDQVSETFRQHLKDFGAKP